MGARKFPVAKVEGCLFFSLFGDFRLPWEFFSLNWRRHYHRWKANIFDTRHSAIEQWGFLNVTCLLCHGPTLRRTRDTYTCCRAFGCLDCHNGEPRSPECVANALHVLLRHRGGQSWKKDVQELMQFYCIVLNTGYILYNSITCHRMWL